ncbi:MAG: hypothetical protein NZ700_16760 [Gemmataceae bacterium]|nr:hypothetical protein [Gemmataceae bacterium]MDW8264401.1 hypothetical protein [Gemmataceae bacterium]
MHFSELSDEDIRSLVQEALKDPRGPGRDRLIESLLEPLTTKAQRLLRQRPPRRPISAEELVNDFLEKKVLPPRKLVVFLQPAVEEPKRLLPRVWRSLANFYEDLNRRAGPYMGPLDLPRPPKPQRRPVDLDDDTTAGPVNDPTDVDPVPPPAPAGSPTFDDIRRRTREQLAELRRVFPPGGKRQVYGPAVRLSERINLAKLIHQAGFPEEEVVQLVEELTPWTAEEEGELIGYTDISLGEAWRKLCSQTNNRVHLSTSETVAQILQVKRNRWHQWVCRGRKKVIEVLGDLRAKDLFPYW